MSQQETIADLLLARLVSERENIETQWRNPVGTKTRHFVVDDLLHRGDCDAIFQAFHGMLRAFLVAIPFGKRSEPPLTWGLTRLS